MATYSNNLISDLTPGRDPAASALKEMGALASVDGVYDWFQEEIFPLTDEEISLGIAHRFSKIAAKFPHRTAIDESNSSLTYKELDEKSNKVAIWLVGKGFRPDVPVAVGTLSTANHIIAILGILKAGGYYLPLAHDWPIERRIECFEMVSVKFFIATEASENIDHHNILSIVLEEILSSVKTHEFSLAMPVKQAFVMFTSGTTGEPKGVIQYQRNILHNSAYQTLALRISPTDRLSQLFPNGKMGAVRAVFNALLNGATLCPFSVVDNNLERFEAWLQEKQPSILHSSASFFRIFVHQLKNKKTYLSIRLLILGGEAVMKTDFEMFTSCFPQNTLFCTGFGSTETTTVCMMLLPPRAKPDAYRGRLPLGYIKPGFEVVCESSKQVADQNSLAERGLLKINSRFLFAGYWPLGNSEQDIADETRLYCTGDLILRKPNGVIFHTGRRDHQVKIRGFRFDLLEMEHVLREIQGVADCALIIEDNVPGNIRVYVFAVSTGSNALSIDKIQYYLRKKLPAQVLPSKIFIIESMPRRGGDKIDYGKLRERMSSQVNSDKQADPLAPYRQGLNLMESGLLKCLEETSYPLLRRWAELTDWKKPIKNVALRDLDIDSLSALEISLNIERHFQVAIDPETLFRFRKIENLIHAIKKYAKD